MFASSSLSDATLTAARKLSEQYLEECADDIADSKMAVRYADENAFGEMVDKITYAPLVPIPGHPADLLPVLEKLRKAGEPESPEAQAIADCTYVQVTTHANAFWEAAEATGGTLSDDARAAAENDERRAAALLTQQSLMLVHEPNLKKLDEDDPEDIAYVELLLDANRLLDDLVRNLEKAAIQGNIRAIRALKK